MVEETGIWITLSQRVFGIQVMYWLIIIGAIIIIILRYKPKEEKYKVINLIKENKKQFKQYFSDYSAKIKFFEKNLLRINYNKIGRIKRITEVNIPIKTRKKIVLETSEEAILEEIKTGKKPDKYSITTKPAKFLAFEIYKDNIIGYIKFFINYGNSYFVVDSKLVTRHGNTFVIDSEATFTNFLGINIFSEKGKSYITDIAFKIMRESELQELVNLTPRMVFMELQSAKYSMRLSETGKAIDKKYKSRQDRLIADETGLAS